MHNCPVTCPTSAGASVVYASVVGLRSRIASAGASDRLLDLLPLLPVTRSVTLHNYLPYQYKLAIARRQIVSVSCLPDEFLRDRCRWYMIVSWVLILVSTILCSNSATFSQASRLISSIVAESPRKSSERNEACIDPQQRN